MKRNCVGNRTCLAVLQSSVVGRRKNKRKKGNEKHEKLLTKNRNDYRHSDVIAGIGTLFVYRLRQTKRKNPKGIIINITDKSNVSEIGEKLLNAQKGKAGTTPMLDFFIRSVDLDAISQRRRRQNQNAFRRKF